MTQRGRQSAAALAAAAALSVVQPKRFEPPRDLDKLERQIWQSTVDAFAPGWFTAEDEQMLRAYVRACANHRLLTEQTRGAAPLLPGKGGAAVANPVFSMLRAEAGVISTLARNLRIAKVARTDPTKKAARPVGVVPGSDAAQGAPWAKTA